MNFKFYTYITFLCLLTGCAVLSSSRDLSNISPNQWEEVFDGKSFKGWKPFIKTKYETGGTVEVKNGAVHLATGQPYSAVMWEGGFPRTNYEVELKAKKIDGNDIFCGLLFPVGTNYCTMILGGWGNSVIGLSCVNYMAAADNETAVIKSFRANEWYDVKLRVTPEKIEAWVEGEQLIDLELAEKTITPYFGLEMFAPFGFFTFETSAAAKDIYVKRIAEGKSL
jgi:hypothetical protein